MKISRRHLAEIIGERTLHAKDAKELAREIAAYLMQERRVAELESLLRDILEYRALHGIVEAKVVSAHDLTAEVVRDAKQILKQEYPHAKEFHINELHDPTVVGGLRLELANEQLDLTVRRKIDTFKRLTVESKE